MVVGGSDDKDFGVGKRRLFCSVYLDTRASGRCMRSMHLYYGRVLVSSSMNEWVERRWSGMRAVAALSASAAKGRATATATPITFYHPRAPAAKILVQGR